MGQVWRATDEVLGREVAVKLLSPGSASVVDAERFRLEAKAAGRISDPHVVAVLDFGKDDDRLFLVTELVAGCSLADELHRYGALPPQRAASLIAQAARGLASAHDHGVVHRDIKPANLLLATNGTGAGTEAVCAADTDGRRGRSRQVDADCSVKVADFGIARVADEGADLTATGQIAGTSHYLAPERALGEPGGPASDVYSLGCVGYHLVTGVPPFRGDVPAAIAFQHVHSAPVPPRDLCPQISDELDDLLLRMLAKDPAQRPSARQVAEWAITTVTEQATQPLGRTRESSRTPNRSSNRSPRRAAYAAAAGAAVALTAAMAWASLHPPTEAERPHPNAPTSVSPPHNRQPPTSSTRPTTNPPGRPPTGAGRPTGATATGPTGQRSASPSTSAASSGESTPAASPDTSTTPATPSPSSPPRDPTTPVASATDQTTPAKATSVPTASPTQTQPTTPGTPPP